VTGQRSSVELHARAGWVGEELADELPGLRVIWTQIQATNGRTSRGVRERLHALSDARSGTHAALVRHRPVPSAYRVFFRQIGLDPDADLPPLEQAMLQRLLAGRFRSRDRVADARTIALIETGVAIWVMDASTLTVPLGIRLARAGERIRPGGKAPTRADRRRHARRVGKQRAEAGAASEELQEGRLVVADMRHAVAQLFGVCDAEHEVTRETTSMVLYALAVEGVPDAALEESLWICLTAIQST
jgi:DNA/RNA-binding domain of Phe-tRNA-synthetase-like protein